MLRQGLEDPEDLVCKRRKAPHTYLDAWKVAKIGSLQHTFMDPLIKIGSLQHTFMDPLIKRKSLI
jgi:hypothetical protein